MNPVKFPEANKNLLKPSSMTDEECSSLWVYNANDESISCWRLSALERLKALVFGKVWLGVLNGKTQPPVRLWCERTIFTYRHKTRRWASTLQNMRSVPPASDRPDPGRS